MEVILLSDVPKVGKKYDLVNVAPGYARNFLLTRGLAEVITKSSAKRVAELQKRRKAEAQHQEELLAKAFAGVKNAVVTVKRSANEEGHLYAGVNGAELAVLLGTAIGATITPEHIVLEKAIKTLGEHTVEAVLGDKKAEFKVVVEAE